MAFALTVDKVDAGGIVRVRHIFYGDTERECEKLRDEHGEGCAAFGPALQSGKVYGEMAEIDDSERPEYDEDPIDV